jgi:hypothetical protein
MNGELVKTIKEYTKSLDLIFTTADCEDLIKHMDEFEIADIKTGVWDFLDAYEGVSHSRDPEFFKDEEKA